MTLQNHEVERLARCLGGVPVLGCSWGSVASRIGLMRGDVVVAVNGVKTPDEMAFNYARSLRDDQLELEVVRDGETLRFYIGHERLRGFDPMFVLDEVVAMRFDVVFP
jgi:predicted metalloprotease with PDZ domain